MKIIYKKPLNKYPLVPKEYEYNEDGFFIGSFTLKRVRCQEEDG